MPGTDVNKNNVKGDMTMWLGKFVGTSQENEKWYDYVPESVLENEDTNPCGTSVCEQIMEMRRGDCTW